MKSLLGKLGVVFVILLIILGCAEMWGKEKKDYVTTDTGYIFYPKVSNDKALVYCHGGFEKVKEPDFPDVNYFVSQGWTVLVLKYEDELKNPTSVTKDIQKTIDAINSFKNKFKSVHLLGVSRGGFVALQTFARYGELFGKCVSVAAPTHIESWRQIRWIPRRWRPYFKEIPDPYESFEKRLPEERFALGKKLLLIYGTQDTLVPAWQGIYLFIKLNCRMILEEDGHTLFRRLENIKKAEAFLGH